MLQVDREGPVLRVALNRPEVRNAFNEELISALFELYSTVSPEIRVIVLSGSGSVFCAGGDLDWMRRAAGFTLEENIASALDLATMLASIRDCHAVTIANVHGAAYGGGVGLVAACDIAIATEDSKFALSEVKLGLIPATISPFVIQKIGPGHARHLFVTGDAFSAQTAFHVGLVHEVVSGQEREAVLQKKIRAVLSAAPRAISEAKKLIFDSPLSLQAAAERLADIRSGDEAREGIDAFLNKRTASYVQAWPIL